MNEFSIRALQVKHRFLAVAVAVARSAQALQKVCPQGWNTTLRSLVKHTLHLLLFSATIWFSEASMFSLFVTNSKFKSFRFCNLMLNFLALSRILVTSSRYDLLVSIYEIEHGIEAMGKQNTQPSWS